MIVVGASAGGIAALQRLLAGLPATLPAAICVVLHILPNLPSYLPLILARAGALPVQLAVDGEPIIPGHVYVARPNHHLIVETDHLRLTQEPKEHWVRPAVDVLFRSAASAFGPRVIGIVLSGMLDDGAAGARAIKDRGGMILVQSHQDAEYPSMPDHTRAHVTVDASLAVADMPALIIRMTHEPLSVAATVPAPHA
jgi:two-component system chemotaxis response regulator CheB